MDAQPETPALADDLLSGAAAIAAYMWGDPDRVRDIYRNPADLPLFHMGGMVCARKSSLRAHVAELEAAAQQEAATKKLAAAKPKPKVKTRTIRHTQRRSSSPLGRRATRRAAAQVAADTS
jgi:hypothetical protein